MARELKPQKVDVVEDQQTGMEVLIMLNRNTLQFFAEFNGDSFADKSADAVKTWAESALRAAKEFVWRGIIIFKEWNDGMGTDSSIQLSYKVERHWVTQSSGGKHMRADWKYQTDVARSANAHSWSDAVTEFPTVRENNYPRGTWHYLLYDEALWQGLVQLISALEAIKTRISDLIRLDIENVRTIGAQIVALLPASTDSQGRDWFKTIEEDQPLAPPRRERPPKDPVVSTSARWNDAGTVYTLEYYTRGAHFNHPKDVWEYLTAQE